MSRPSKWQLCLVAFLFTIIKIDLYSQGETSQWFLYKKQHYSFTKNGFSILPSTPITNGDPITSVSDSAGNLLLIVSNGIVYDRNYNKLPFYTKSFQQRNLASTNVYLVKKPGSSSQYYFFYSAEMFSNSSYIFGVYYKLIDLALNNGFGDVVKSDVLVDDYTSKGFTIISAYNKDNFWVITHKKNTNNFNSWNVTSGGINASPVKSTAGMDVNTKEYDYPHLKASPNGKYIAGIPSYYYGGQFPFFRRFIEVYNFDTNTGTVNTHVKSFDDADVGGVDDDVEFSPDSRLLYVKYDYYSPGLQPCGFAAGNLWQYNVCYTDSVSFSSYFYYLGDVSSFCVYYLWGNLQLAPDKKIYMPYSGSVNATSIQNPNVIGSSANYKFSTPGFKNEGSNTLPSFYQGYMEEAVQNNIVYSGGCYPNPLNFSITNNTLQYVQWNFSDAASGVNNISTLINPSHIFSAPGIYNVSGILYSTPGVPYDTIYSEVEIKDPSKRLLTGLPKDTSMCAGGKFPVGLSVVNGIFYWRKRYKGYLENLICSDSIEIGDWGDGTYIVEMHQNDCNGCILTDSINFHTLKTPSIYLGDSAAFCIGDSVQLYTYNPGATAIWNTGDTTQIIWVKKPGIYWVQEEYNNNRCIVRDSIKIKSNPGVKFSLPADTTLCNNSTLLLNPGIKNAYYYWQDNSYQTSYLVTQPGKYWVKITDYSGCNAGDTINVSYVNGNAVYLGNDTSLCAGDSLFLQSNIINANYLWNTGAVTPSIYVSQSGDYSLKVSNGTCTVEDTITVTFTKKPVFSLGNDTVICQHQTLLLNPGINGNYIWQDGSSGNSYAVQNAGLYWLKITQNGCTLTDSVSVSYQSLPQANLGSDTGFCNGQSLLLNAYNNYISSYLWQDNSNQSTYLVSNSGNYYVQVTGSNNCINSDTINIAVAQPPSFSLGADTVVCDTKTLNYNFNIPGATYLWNDGNTSNTYTISAAGSYQLTVSQSGCSSSDDITVNYKPSPLVNLGNDTSLCQNDVYTLNAYYPNATYQWQDKSTQATYNVTKPGNYYALLALNGCINSDTINISYTSPPVFSLGNDTSLCPGQTITLEPKVTGGINYTWQDGSTLNNYTIKTAGQYSLQVANTCGSATDAINVTTAACLLEMPNAFTPNSDGKNDVFRVKYPEFIKEFEMIIYNRWGAKIFETKDPRKGWDGNLNSQPQGMGSYVWIIKLTDYNNKVQTSQGLVTLLR